MDKYDPSKIESKWQKFWEQSGLYKPDLDLAKNPFLNLMMFPYPSAEGLHVGNMYAFTGSDIYGRFKRMQGFSVFEPIGLDGFGIHSENYALKVGRYPKEQAKISENNFYQQLRATGNAFDWSRAVETYDPDYYKWTQWIFIQMFKKGLAYRKQAPVNFCPSCKTVLADEQVITKVKSQKSKVKTTTQNSKFEETGEKIGICERCETPVEKKELEQWFFKITDYAERLLKGLDRIDWTEKVKIAQKNWIGKSEGMEIRFKIDDLRLKNEEIVVYTVFPETIYGTTYMVLAPEHPLITSLVNFKIRGIKEYVQKAQKKSELEQGELIKEKTGIFTGLYCLNPVNNRRIPIWIADYVLAEYGTGAVMGVPGSDHRDFEFAKKYKLSIIRVIGKTKDDISEVVSEKEVLEEGCLVNSEQFTGLLTPDPGREKVKNYLEEKGWGKRKTTYHLRDWLISRQRYWGPPIPMINCPKCAHSTSSGQGWVPEKEENLPVLLPDVKDWKPNTSTSLSVKGPLANHPEFYKVACPKCGGEAQRETDVSDTFLDSAWYFLRYLATDRDDMPFPSKAFSRNVILSEAKNLDPSSRLRRTQDDISERVKWLPVDMYIGGAEHSVLHLMYARFITMTFHDWGLIDFEEPFKKFYAHGLLISEGAKISKSKGNVISPDVYIQKYGVDTLRCYLMFLGPFSQGGDFQDAGIEGMNRFLKKVWKLAEKAINTPEVSPSRALSTMHKTIKKVTEDIENLRYNTALAALMEWHNHLIKQAVAREEIETFLRLLAPFAPHMTEELYQNVILRPKAEESRKGSFANAQDDSEFCSIHQQTWPKYDPKMIQEKEMIVVVQINGKMRGVIKVQSSEFRVQSLIENRARESERVKKYIEGKEIKKVIYVPGKIINFVVAD